MRELESTADEQLLKAFAEKRDEESFAELVRRHGPLVFNLCRRVLGNRADAEDAAQAAFLTLAREASRRHTLRSVAAWLHRVAHNIALNALTSRKARKRREQEAAAMARHADHPTDLADEHGAMLHEEINALPEKYRQAVILCYVEGKTQEQAATIMTSTASSVGTWAARGRERLRSRLARRGLVLSLAVLTSLLSAEAGAAELPATFVTSTTTAAARFVAENAGAGAGTSTLSSVSALLAEGALKKMSYARLQMVSLTVVVLLCIAGGGGWLLNRATCAEGGGMPAEKKDAEKQDATDKAAGKKGAREKNAQDEKGETNRAVVGSCVVTASQPLGFIDMMPSLKSRRGSGRLVARITLTFDNTKGNASTLSISGAVLDATGRRYDVVWLDRETSKPWDGKIDKGKSKTLTFLARLAKHKIGVGGSIRIVVVVTDKAGHKATLTSDPVRIVGAM